MPRDIGAEQDYGPDTVAGRDMEARTKRLMEQGYYKQDSGGGYSWAGKPDKGRADAYRKSEAVRQQTLRRRGRRGR